MLLRAIERHVEDGVSPDLVFHVIRVVLVQYVGVADDRVQ